MKITKKIMAMLLSLAMVLSFIPANVARANLSGNITLTFSGPWDVGGVSVSADKSGEVTVAADDVITLTNFNSETMEAYLHASDGFETTLVVDVDGKTSLSTSNADGVPNSATLEFLVREKNNGGGGGGNETAVGVQFDNANVSGNTITFTVQAQSGDVEVTANVTGVTEGVAEWNGSVLNIDRGHLGDVIFTFDDAYDNDNMGVRINGAAGYSNVLAVSESKTCSLGGLGIPDGGIHFEIYYGNFGGGGENHQPVGNKKAKINLSGPEGSWQVAPMVYEEYDIVTEEYSSMEYSKYAYVVDVSINGGQRTEAVSQYSKGMDLSRYASQEITYNREDSEDKVDIKFFSNWGNRIESVKINGTSYDIPLNYDDRNAWLNAFGGQGIGFTIEDVPVSTDTDTDGNEIYNIEVKVRPITEEECYIGNFLWSNDDRMDPDIEGNKYNDMYIGHSNLELLSITYDDGTGEHTVDYEDLLDENGNETLPFIHQSTNTNFETGIEMSEMVVPEGSWVTMKIETKYGYQVKSFDINGSDIRLGDTSVFSFRIGKGNFHIGAHVEKQEDEAKVEADMVSDAAVELAEGTLETGSARLEVADAKISDEKKADFENEADEAGYEIESYLDLSLNQVFYKGTGNSNDVWANPMNDLKEPATIALALSDDIDPENVTIIHNIHNGDEFEVIETEYIEEYNAIAFETDSFSDFAIASKAEEKPEPKTSTGTVSSEGILVIQDSPSIVAGMVHAKSDAKDDVEFRWVACEENTPNAWFEISPWTKNNEWVNWTPTDAGNYILVCFTRVVGNEEKSQISKSVGVVYSKHVIKDICQIPYNDGYLIGFESTQNPNQSYQYEMLVMDLTLFASGNPNCWILSTGRATVSEGNAIWITWKPEYGYYLTLFRIYDGEGHLLDQTCYGFANAY
ncbi:MAG: hypothetical protein IJ054_08340 [Lachnospiraceae bacterium]|nr:hypothetical protein [Lachnospiraceae bacterium]